MALLAWIGRQRARALAASVLISIVLPPLSAILKPYATEAVIGLLCIAFLRIDIEEFRSYLRKPGIIVAATLWTTIAVPLLFAFVCTLLEVSTHTPELYLGFMLQAVASPMMAAPAIAAIMGLDATLVLITLVTSTALTPFTAPVIASIIGLQLSLSPLILGMKLFAILTGSAITGLILQRIIGPTAIIRHRDSIDGVNIIILFIFISAVVGEVGVRFLADPLFILGLTAIAFIIFILILLITYAVFLWTGQRQALAIGMLASQRNMGLMLAATGGVLPDLTWLYFALGQFPVYLAPQILQPIARYVNRPQD